MNFQMPLRRRDMLATSAVALTGLGLSRSSRALAATGFRSSQADFRSRIDCGERHRFCQLDRGRRCQAEEGIGGSPQRHGHARRDRRQTFTVAERYRALLDVGAAAGVVPQIELWGFSTNLSRLGEVMFVATEAAHPDACVLPDVYHIYKGGSDFAGLKMLDGNAVPVFHMNDYPAEPSREEMKDADRVYTGDGVAPLTDILRTLRDAGGQTVLSLELFNPNYWKQPALEVAKTGLEKMKESVAIAMSQ